MVDRTMVFMFNGFINQRSHHWGGLILYRISIACLGGQGAIAVGLGGLASGNLLQSELENLKRTIEIVDNYPIKTVIFHSYVNVYQRV